MIGNSLKKIGLVVLLGTVVAGGYFLYRDQRIPQVGDVQAGREVEHIDNCRTHYGEVAQPGAFRQSVLQIFPRPMNSDTEVIVCWVIPGDGEGPESLVGKRWRELIRGRDGYYLIFDHEGKLLAPLNTVSGWPPEEAIVYFSSKDLL